MESLGPVTVSGPRDEAGVSCAMRLKPRFCGSKLKGKCFEGTFRERGKAKWSGAIAASWLAFIAPRSAACGARSNRSPLSISNVSCKLGSMFRREANSTAPMERCKSSGSCKVMRFPRLPGNRRFCARRIAKYDPEFLDELCFSGEVMWARVSPHPAIAENRRVRPTRIAPVTLFLREDAEWLMRGASPADSSGLSHPARDVLLALERNGASFSSIWSRQTGRLPSEVEDGLWELLAGGFVTADGFDNLRALIDPKRRRGEGRGSKKRPRHAAGRWALLRHVDAKIRRRGAGPAFRAPVAHPMGRPVARLAGSGNTCAAVAGSAAGTPQDGSARRDSRREICFRFYRRTVCPARSARLITAIRREPGLKAIVSVSNADPLNLTGIILPGPRVSRLAVIGRVPPGGSAGRWSPLLELIGVRSTTHATRCSS